MTTYRHRWERTDRRCTTPSDGDPRDICGCTTPTPDPASPCGYEDPWAKYGHPFPSCGRPEAHTHHTFSGGRKETPDGGHFYRATRCATCGHAIEPVKEETHA